MSILNRITEAEERFFNEHLRFPKFLILSDIGLNEVIFEMSMQNGSSYEDAAERVACGEHLDSYEGLVVARTDNKEVEDFTLA